jgi:hypothetical protein
VGDYDLISKKTDSVGNNYRFSLSKMGGQTAFGLYDPDAKLVSYYFMGDSAMNDITSNYLVLEKLPKQV